MARNDTASRVPPGGAPKRDLLSSLMMVFEQEQCSSLAQMLKLTSLCSRCSDSLRRRGGAK